MELTVLDQNFAKIYILESYESLIWVDRFNEPGAFELYSPVTDDILTYFKPNYYLTNDESEHTMIIEDISIESDIENGNKIKVIGRSLESLLDRRIIWDESSDAISFKEGHNLQKAIRKLVERNISSSTKNKIAARRIANFILDDPSTDTSITSLTLVDGAQYNGSNTLLDVVQSLCSANNIGFKVILEGDTFVFSLYNGVNRDYSQDERPYVVYSPEFDNVLNSNYKEENSIVKNVALISNGDENDLIIQTVGTETGINRRELYVDAGDVTNQIKQEDDDETESTITRNQVKKLMVQRGKEELANIARSVKTFDAKCDTTTMYVYGKDFFMGDIVQLENEYGIKSRSRVTEFTWSSSISGMETYPTFISIEGEVGS